MHISGIIEGSIKCTSKELQLKPTLMGGQCFRWRQYEEEGKTSWKGVFKHNVWTLSQTETELQYKVLSNRFSNSSTKEHKCERKTAKKCSNHSEQLKNVLYFENLLSDYLRLNENLEDLYNDWAARDSNFKQISQKFFGIRVLKQDPVENLFSFICSTNNNIARITSMVEKLCLFYGEKIAEIDGTTYYDFPKVSCLAKKGVEEKLRKEGFGYRAKYIYNSAVKIMELGGETWLEQLQTLPYKEAKDQLMTLPGIGAKVADCICLMSMNHLEAIPVDTHVFQISQRYLPHLKSCKTVTDKVYNEIVCYFQKMYGEYAGWAHSVLFCADLRQFQSSNKSPQNTSEKGNKRRKLSNK